MYQMGVTIAETLMLMREHKMVLPAIQREFVWSGDQICAFFDSLMLGYPFGTFLYWKVQAEHSADFQWYDFVRDYHQKDRPHCPPLPSMRDTDLTAVLDGQQRLTALNIGLNGSMAWKNSYGRWNNPGAFPTRHLYLDLLADAELDADEELTSAKRFKFRTEDEVRNTPEGECWFKVSDVMGMQSAPPQVKWLNKQGLSGDPFDRAFEVLDTLSRVIHVNLTVVGYEEKGQDIENVLQIFIRMNKGGTVLSYSDLLLSTAVAQWGDLDARREVHEFVDNLNQVAESPRFNKDFVLRAGLMLCLDIPVAFKVKSFNRQNMDVMKEGWPSVKRTLLLTVRLAKRFGIAGDNLPAANALLPIAYYLHKSDRNERFLTHSSDAADRERIRRWLIRSLLKQGVWGSGVDTLLTGLRQSIQDSGTQEFPIRSLERAMATKGKSIVFSEEEIDDLVDVNYGRRAFLLLSLLFPFVDLNNLNHIDHIFPTAKFTSKTLANIKEPSSYDSYSDMINRLPNLQLLEGAKNVEKQAMMPAEWLRREFPDPIERDSYTQKHMLGNVPESMDGFDEFYEARQDQLKRKIMELLG